MPMIHRIPEAIGGLPDTDIAFRQDDRTARATCSIQRHEEALHDSAAMRRLVDIDLGREPATDDLTACKIRHRLEKHNLAEL